MTTLHPPSLISNIMIYVKVHLLRNRHYPISFLDLLTKNYGVANRPSLHLPTNIFIFIFLPTDYIIHALSPNSFNASKLIIIQ